MLIKNWHKFSVALLLGMSITFWYIFMRAFVHGYQTMVMINALGEANIEFVMVNVILFFGFVVTCDMLRDGTSSKAECPTCSYIFKFTKEENLTFVMCPRCGMIGAVDGLV